MRSKKLDIYIMDDKEIKALKKTLEHVKKSKIFKELEKEKKNKKVA